MAEDFGVCSCDDLLIIRHTWFDRDLGLAGRVLVEDKQRAGVIEGRLLLIPRHAFTSNFAHNIV